MTTFEQGHALVVGVGGDLPNTVDDATGIADMLRDAARCAYPPGQVHLLTGEGATRAAVLAAFETIAQSSAPQSTVLVYFSGHGYRVTSPTGEFYYLLPYGYDLDRLYQTALSGAEFAARLRAIRAQKLLVLLDCCHAGSVGHAGGIGEAKVAGLQLAKAPLPPEAQALLAEGSGRVLIASSREDELSFAGKPYSAFTLALVEALCGMGVAKQDGYVRVADLALHARQVVPARTWDRQHPILHFEHAHNFVLACYAGGQAQPKGLPFAGVPEIEPEPGAWRVGLHGQFGDRVTITGDGNVVGNGSTSHVVKVEVAEARDSTIIAAGGDVVVTPRGSEALDLAPSPKATHLHRILSTRLDLEELRTLCFDLGVEYDSLGGEGLAGKARQLVQFLQKRNALPVLVEWLRRERRDVGL